MAVRPQPHLFSVEEYYRMSQAGILDEDDHVELIEGEIVEMTPIGSRHAACVKRLNALFSRQVSDRAIVQVQDPVRLGEYSEPQPDLALLRLQSSFYAEAHPGPGDVLLLVEVAETSSRYDRDVKIPLYAEAGICEVWIVDLSNGRLEIYLSPSHGDYQEESVLGRGDQAVPSALPHLVVDVAEIMGT
jgi:Uma2 family endonuclease